MVEVSLDWLLFKLMEEKEGSECAKKNKAGPRFQRVG